MADEVLGSVSDVQSTFTTDNYSPSAIGDEWSEGFDGVPEYDTFEEGIAGIGKFIKSLFSSTDSTKETAKAKSVTLTTTPTTAPSTSTSNITVVALDKACQAEFAEAGMAIPLQIGSAESNVNHGASFQSLAISHANTGTIPEQTAIKSQAVTLFGSELAQRRGKGETPADAVAAEFLIASAAVASGRSLGAADVANLVINAAGRIINQSANVTQSTKQPKPERNYVAVQNAEQQKQNAAAFAAFSLAISLASGKSISTNISGAFSANTFGGLTGSYQPDQGLVYSFPVETYDGEIVDVLDKDLQARYGNVSA